VRQHALSCLASLPSLGVSPWRKLNQKAATGAVLSGDELKGLCKHPGGGLRRWLEDACSKAQVVDAGEQEERRQRAMETRLLPQFLAQSSAALIHGLESRLLIIEPEGFLKKRTNLTVKCEAKSQARLDSFLAGCVPLLRALLLHPTCQITCRATEQGGVGAGQKTTTSDEMIARDVEWHPAAPLVALATDFGEEDWRNKKHAALDKIAKTLEDLRCV